MIAANANSINYGFIVSFIDFVYKITMATQFFLTRFSCKKSICFLLWWYWDVLPEMTTFNITVLLFAYFYLLTQSKNV